MERRASCYRRTRIPESKGSWFLAMIWVDNRARLAPVVLDAGLLGLAAARLEARVDAALERESCGRRIRRCAEAGKRRRGAAATEATRARDGAGEGFGSEGFG
jgi:hypothetical protein